MVLTPPDVHQRIRASASVSARAGEHHLQFEAMATRCRVSFSGPAAAAKAFPAAVVAWVAQFEARYSRFLPDSLVSRINQNAGVGWVDIDAETAAIFGLCDEAHFLTRGVFDPTALPLIKLWNWKAVPPVVPGDAEIQAAMKLVGWPKVQRAPGKVFLPATGMSIDLGGIGKEYAVDRVAQIATQHGITSALVDFGQDVFTLGVPADGRPAWHIGLEDPQNPGKCWAGVAARNQAVATSGDYFRRFEIDGKRYGHIIDVRTGRPVANGCRAVSVIGPSCTLAGLLATAAFVLGAEEGIQLLDAMPNMAGCITLEERRVQTRRFHEYVVS
jgi:thiamine biosynthesis lipoprotein